MLFAESKRDKAPTRRDFLAGLAAVIAVPALSRCGSESPSVDTPAGSDPGTGLFHPVPPASEPLMRVRVLRVAGPGAQVLIGRATQWLALGASPDEGTEIVLRGPVVVHVGPDRWSVTDANGVSAAVDGFEPLQFAALSGDEHDLVVQKRAYPGRIRLVSHGDKGDRGFDVINLVDMEAYLPGVVTAELFAHWLGETRAAQAIAARSFAASEHQWFRNRREWDVTNTAHSQVYRGRTDHGPSLEAVEMTRGVVLGFQGGLVPGYYSSCCGGIAASALDAIGPNPVNGMRPLEGRAGEDVCTSAAIARWTIDRDVSQLTRRLATWGRRDRRSDVVDLGQVATIECIARNEHGRPTRYAITDTTGRSVELSAQRLRSAANFSGDGLAAPQRRLWSSNVAVTISDGTASFAGQGMGHGVGLCQYGAETLARAGTDHQEILRWYYPDVEFVKGY